MAKRKCREWLIIHEAKDVIVEDGFRTKKQAQEWLKHLKIISGCEGSGEG